MNCTIVYINVLLCIQSARIVDLQMLSELTTTLVKYSFHVVFYRLLINFLIFYPRRGKLSVSTTI